MDSEVNNCMEVDKGNIASVSSLKRFAGTNFRKAIYCIYEIKHWIYFTVSVLFSVEYTAC